MSTQQETIILSIKIDNGDLTRKVADNNAQLDQMKKQLKDMKAVAEDAMENGLVATAADATEEVAKLENQIRSLSNETKQYKNTIDESTKANKAAEGSYEQLYRQWKLAEVELKTMEGALKRNADGTFSLTEKYFQNSAAVKQAKDGLLQFNKGVLDGRLNVGNYDNSISGLEQKLNDLTAAFKEMDTKSPQFEQTREAIQNTKQEIDQLTGKVNEFGEREPKNPTKKGLNDTAEAARGVTEAFTLLTLIRGEDEKASAAETAVIKGVAIATAALNTIKGAKAALETLELIRKKLIVQAEIENTAVLGAEAVATEGATVAQEGLNVAMEANPVGILILALVALGGALVGLNAWMTMSSDETDKLEKENKKLTETLTEQNRVIGDQVKVAEAQLGLSKAQGESAEELRKKEEAINEAKEKQLTNNIKMIQSAIALDKSKINDVIANDSLWESYLRLWVAIDKWIGADKEAEALEKQIAVNKAERAKEALDDLKKQQDALAEAQAALLDQKTTEQNQENELRNKNLKAQEDHLNQLLAVTQDGTKRKFDVQMAILSVQQAEELAAEDLTESQKGAIYEKYQNLRAAATRQFAAAALKDQQTQLMLEIAIMQNGTKLKLDEQIRLLKLQEEEELAVITLSEAAKANIKEKYRQLELKAQQDSDKIFLQDFETTLQLELKALESKSQQSVDLRKKELDLTLEILDTQEAEELANVELNETEKENIREKYRQARVKAEADTNRQIFDDAVKAKQLQLEAEFENLRTAGADTMAVQMEIAAAQRDAILNDTKSTNEERLKAEADYNAAVAQIQFQHVEYVKKTYAMQAAIIGNFMSSINSLLEIFGANQTALNQFAKISALFQIAIETAKAISGVVAAASLHSPDPISLAIQISAGIATVLANIAQAKKIIQGTEQPAAPTIQGFAGGGVSGKKITASDGTASSINKGDNVLITARTGEVILNEDQQQRLGGAATFAAIGVPGFYSGGPVGTITALREYYSTSSNHYIPSFDTGGLLLSNYTQPINNQAITDRQMSVLQQLADRPVLASFRDFFDVQQSETIRIMRANI